MKLLLVFLLAFSGICVSAQTDFEAAFDSFQPSESELAKLDSAYTSSYSKALNDSLMKFSGLYEIEKVKFRLHTLEYMRKANNYRRAVFNWQLISSVIIFVMVLLIVGAGLYFSAKQFDFTIKMWERKVSADNRTKEIVTESAASIPVLDSSVKISASSMEVSSPVLGVTILTLSIVFFFLYLRYVYPISVLSDKDENNTVSTQLNNPQ